MRVACVGRTAERGCLYSAIVNDKHRAAGRSGVGTVMASKNLKALAVRGTRGVGNVEDPKAFMAAVDAGKDVLAENAVTGQGLPTYGTQVLMNVINEVGALPTRNMRDVGFEGAEHISAEAMAEPRKSDGKPNLTTNGGCFGCTIACGRISTVDPTHFSVKDKPQYKVASGGLEYEAAWALGADTGVDDLDALTYVNFLCNEDGMDPISFGATVAAAMEMFEDRRDHDRAHRRHRTDLRQRRGARRGHRSDVRRRGFRRKTSVSAPSGCAKSTATPSCR